VQLRQDLDDRASDRLTLPYPQKAHASAVDDGDVAVGVEANDAGGRSRENRFGEPASAVDLLAGSKQGGALAPKLGGHGVERDAQGADVAVRCAWLDLDGEVAA